MKITILGSGKEVGRSGFMVTSDNTNILLDYGVLLKREPFFPIHVRPKDISTVVLTHAHLDHSGFIPSLFYPILISQFWEQIQPSILPIFLLKI